MKKALKWFFGGCSFLFFNWCFLIYSQICLLLSFNSHWELVKRYFYSVIIKCTLELLKQFPSYRPVFIGLRPYPDTQCNLTFTQIVYIYRYFLIADNPVASVNHISKNRLGLSDIRIITDTYENIYTALLLCCIVGKAWVCECSVRNNYCLIVNGSNLSVK